MMAGVFHAQSRDHNTSQTFGHVYEIDKRLGLHLLHDLSAVLLDGDFAIVELDRDLFVEQSLHDQTHHLAFLGRKLIITLAKFGYAGTYAVKES